jgi:hypothetical protein
LTAVAARQASVATSRIADASPPSNEEHGCSQSGGRNREGKCERRFGQIGPGVTRRVQYWRQRGLVYEDGAARPHQPVGIRAGWRGNTDDRLIEGDARFRALEGGITKTEHTAIGCGQPVTTPVRCRRHSDDGAIEGEASGRSVKSGVAKGENAAIGGHQPIAVPAGRRRHADHRPIEPERSCRTVKVGIPEGENASIGGHQPVASTVRGAAMPTIGRFRWTPPAEP